MREEAFEPNDSKGGVRVDANDAQSSVRGREQPLGFLAGPSMQSGSFNAASIANPGSSKESHLS